MQQRQLRLGDILDDYCPRERRVTNHAVVAMVGPDVKQTRCTTCDADHEYKHAKVPRQRKKSDTTNGLIAQVLASGPKRTPGHAPENGSGADALPVAATAIAPPVARDFTAPESDLEEDVIEAAVDEGDEVDAEGDAGDDTESPDAFNKPDADGPVHRPLIRATLPRIEGQPPAARPAPDFTIRQPAGRQNRFKPRHARPGVQGFFGQRAGGNGNGPQRGPRHTGGRPPQGGQGGGPSRGARRQGRKRSK